MSTAFFHTIPLTSRTCPAALNSDPIRFARTKALEVSVSIIIIFNLLIYQYRLCEVECNGPNFFSYPQVCCTIPLFSSLLVFGSLHCPSCIPSAKSALSRLSIDPVSVEVSVTQQSVKVTSPRGVSRSEMCAALYDAGFDVENESGDYVLSSSPSSLLPAAFHLPKRRSRHLRTCMRCTGLATRATHASRRRAQKP